MKYLKLLREIDKEVYYNMGKVSQRVIDTIEEVVGDLGRDTEEAPIERDELGSIRYDIDTLLEFFDAVRKYEIEILKKIDKILEAWYEDIEFRNIALGIPKEKG